MSVLWAVLSTLSIGLGEFFAGDVTKRARSHEVTTTMFLAGTISMVVVAALWRGDPTAADYLYGAIGGVCNGVAILLMYRSYSTASLRVVAPTAAVVMSAIPVLWDVAIAQNTPSLLVSVGLVLGLVAIALSSYTPGSDRVTLGGVRLAIVAGAIFGVLIITISYIEEGSGASPLLVQRVIAFAIALAVTRATGPRFFPSDRRDFAQSFIVGLFATTAIILFFVALQSDGSLAIVAVVGSQFAAVAVVLGIVFRGERLWWWQAVGLVAASIAVALISAG